MKPISDDVINTINALSTSLYDNNKPKRDVGNGMLQNIQSLISRLEKDHQCDSDYDCEHCFHDTCIEKIDRDDIVDELKEIIAPSLELKQAEEDILDTWHKEHNTLTLPQEIIDEMFKVSSNIVYNDVSGEYNFAKDLIERHDGTTARELVGYKISEDGSQEPVFRDMAPEDEY